MKDDKLYPFYVVYLDWQLNESKINKGKYSLFRISNSKFDEFKSRFDNDELFSDKIIELYKSEIRDKKIDNIFNDIN
jgi:hypothetical protein